MRQQGGIARSQGTPDAGLLEGLPAGTHRVAAGREPRALGLSEPYAVEEQRPSNE